MQLLVALCADEMGEFYTIPLAPKGRRLFLNYETRGTGWIKAGVVGSNTQSVANCDRLAGDAVKAPVTWQGQDAIELDEDGAVALHVQMCAAKLYSFEFR